MSNIARYELINVLSLLGMLKDLDEEFSEMNRKHPEFEGSPCGFNPCGFNDYNDDYHPECYNEEYTPKHHDVDDDSVQEYAKANNLPTTVDVHWYKVYDPLQCINFGVVGHEEDYVIIDDGDCKYKDLIDIYALDRFRDLITGRGKITLPDDDDMYKHVVSLNNSANNSVDVYWYKFTDIYTGKVIGAGIVSSEDDYVDVESALAINMYKNDSRETKYKHLSLLRNWVMTDVKLTTGKMTVIF